MHRGPLVIDKTLNQGEGSVRVERRYDRTVSDFARSPGGGPHSDFTAGTTADKAVTLDRAERTGSSRAEYDDPGVSRHHNRKTRT
jgi:hypothetical protein